MMSETSLRVPYALAVHNEQEEKRVLSVLREKRTILGKETLEFEDRVAKIFGNEYGVMVNSGSSANLLAVELLGLPKGSEVITPILTFATTVAPIVMKDLVPVFVDVVAGSYLLNLDQVEKAITKKTKALMVPLFLGNVPDLDRIKRLSKRHNLFVILDSCDTLGATFKNKKVGKYGDIITTSFYGSHIITAGGGGGMVLTSKNSWNLKARELRGWGRGSASTGESEDPKSRFKNKISGSPYDSKFLFTQLGYNLLPIEIGSAFGNAQLEKLGGFRKTREKNFSLLIKFFNKYTKYFILPSQPDKVSTQWISFPLTIKLDAPFSRFDLVQYLEKNDIQTRPIFTGVITKQPGFKKIKFKLAEKKFPVSELVTRNGMMIGCHQGMQEKHIIKIGETFKDFLAKFV